MATFAPIHASGSTDGRPIKVVATATAGTTLHTATSGSTIFDDIFVAAYNSDTVPRLLTIELGGVTDPDDLIEMTIPAQDGLHIVVPKGSARLNNSAVVGAFAAAANVIVCTVTVDRRTP